MRRLSGSELALLPDSIERPGYDRSTCGVGIAHLGIGAFHRAHQAVYTDDVLRKQGGDWRITGVSLRSASVAAQLNPQDGLYTVHVKSRGHSRYRVIGSVAHVLVAPDDPAAVVDLLAAENIRILSLTVTEKGYCHDPASGDLQVDHPLIQRDLETPELPVSAPGFLVAAIGRRRAAGLEPFTVVCCDNLPGNGETLRNIVTQHAALRDRDLARWIEDHVRFPSTMVDRIVPASTNPDREDAAVALGREDHGLVVTEPFNQWVIEDCFGAARPQWELGGAQLVADVGPYEIAKLRMLNGSHSTLAYLGYLGGYEFVHDSIADDAFRQFVDRLMQTEIAPTLNTPAGLDVETYRSDLIERFANPALHHRCWQIAMDGSQKLPQRILGTTRDRLAAGAPIDGLALSVAAWIRYVHGADEQGRRIDVQDPLAGQLAAATVGMLEQPQEAVARVLGMTEIFGADLGQHPAFRDAVTAAARELVSSGARHTVRQTLSRLRTPGSR